MSDLSPEAGYEKTDKEYNSVYEETENVRPGHCCLSEYKISALWPHITKEKYAAL